MQDLRSPTLAAFSCRPACCCHDQSHPSDRSTEEAISHSYQGGLFASEHRAVRLYFRLISVSELAN